MSITAQERVKMLEEVIRKQRELLRRLQGACPYRGALQALVHAVEASELPSGRLRSIAANGRRLLERDTTTYRS